MSDMSQNDNDTTADEMTEDELDQVAGGGCATGQHFPPVKLVGLTSILNQSESLSSNTQQSNDEP